MTRNQLALIAILLIAFVPVAAVAGPGDGPGERGRFDPGFGPGGPRGQFLPPPGYLDLSDEQRDAAQAIRDGVRDEMGALRDQGRTLRQDLDAALKGDSPDAAIVGQLMIDLHALRPQFRSLLESAEADFAALLDEEQLQKWENWKEIRQSRRGDRGERGERGERRRHRERRGPGPDGPPGSDG